jgi:hypothetical protein
VPALLAHSRPAAHDQHDGQYEPDRYDPEQRIVRHSAAEPLLDHLIRPLQERLRDRETEGLGGLEVDD